MGENIGKIQVYNKKFQNSKLSKIRFWLKQVFIEEKKQMVPFEGEQSLSDTVCLCNSQGLHMV